MELRNSVILYIIITDLQIIYSEAVNNVLKRISSDEAMSEENVLCHARSAVLDDHQGASVRKSRSASQIWEVFHSISERPERRLFGLV